MDRHHAPAASWPHYMIVAAGPGQLPVPIYMTLYDIVYNAISIGCHVCNLRPATPKAMIQKHAATAR